MSKRILNFDDRVDSILQELKQQLKMPINNIITMIVNEKLEDMKYLKKEYIDDFNIEYCVNEIQIKFRINENEKKFLEHQMIKTGNSSLTSEIRFRLLNSIYKNKYFLPIELSEFKNLVYQLKMIGLNINGIFKRVNFKEELKSEDFINLQNYTKEVNEKINLISNELQKIFKFANKRE